MFTRVVDITFSRVLSYMHLTRLVARLFFGPHMAPARRIPAKAAETPATGVASTPAETPMADVAATTAQTPVQVAAVETTTAETPATAADTATAETQVAASTTQRKRGRAADKRPPQSATSSPATQGTGTLTIVQALQIKRAKRELAAQDSTPTPGLTLAQPVPTLSDTQLAPQDTVQTHPLVDTQLAPQDSVQTLQLVDSQPASQPVQTLQRVEDPAAHNTQAEQGHPPETPTAAKSAPKSKGVNVSQDKGLYNACNFRLNHPKCPPEIKSKYQALCKDGTDAELLEMQLAIAGVKRKHYPEELLEKCRAIEKIETKEDKGQWVSWQTAERRDGYDVLMAMYKAGTITLRRNPKLPEGADVPWPRDQQVAYETECWSTKHRTIDRDRLNEPQAPNNDDAALEFRRRFDETVAKAKAPARTIAAKASAPPPSGTAAQRAVSPSPSPTKTHEEIATEKAALASLRKAHNSWDRNKRDWSNAVTQSKENKNTRGSQFEKDLEFAIVKGDDLDKAIDDIEKRYRDAGNSFSNQLYEEGALKTKEFETFLKENSKKKTALTSWWGIGHADNSV